MKDSSCGHCTRPIKVAKLAGAKVNGRRAVDLETAPTAEPLPSYDEAAPRGEPGALGACGFWVGANGLAYLTSEAVGGEAGQYKSHYCDERNQ